MQCKQKKLVKKLLKSFVILKKHSNFALAIQKWGSTQTECAGCSAAR